MRGNIELHAYIRERIDEARQLAGFNKSELARRLSVGKSTYLDFDAGRTKYIDITFLLQIAEVTGRTLSFFVPDAKAPDLATGLKIAYPDLSTASVGEILDFAGLVAERDRRVRNVGNAVRGESSAHNEDTP